jgi:retron-type reverse transcriptase
LREHIHDERFIHLIETLLQAGYLEDWHWNATHSGVPQGSIIGPCLSNLYLNKLDQFVETVLIPEYTTGTKRKIEPVYDSLIHRAAYLRRTGRKAEARVVRKQAQQRPSVMLTDPTYRRLRYCRYADDVRHLTRCSIPLTERRSSEEPTSGSPNQLGGESQRGKEHVGKAVIT